MSSSFVSQRNVIPNQGTSPSLPGNSGAADSSQPGGFKKFFSSTRNVVLLFVGIIVLGTVLGVGAGSGWFSGESAKRSDVPDTPSPDSTKEHEEYERRHRPIEDERNRREGEETERHYHRGFQTNYGYGKAREEGSGEPAYSSLVTYLHSSFQNNNLDFDYLVKRLNVNNLTKSSQLEQVISEYFKKYSQEGYSPEGMSPKIEKLKRFFNTDRTLEKRILEGIRLGTVDSLVESLRNQNIPDSDVQSAVENLSSDYVLFDYQKKRLAEFDFSFRGQSSKSLYFDRMFDLYITNHSVQSNENLFKDLSRFLSPSEIKEETTRFGGHYTLNPLMYERLIRLEKMCESAINKEVNLKNGKEPEVEVLRIITEVLNGPDEIAYDVVISKLSKFPREIIVSSSDIVRSTRNSRNYFLSYLKYHFGHLSLSKHILEAIAIYTKGLTPSATSDAVAKDLWKALRSHFGKGEILDAIDELKTSQTNPWFKFLENKCRRLPQLSFPDIHQAILNHLGKPPHNIDQLALEIAGMGKNRAQLNTAIKEFQDYEFPDKKALDFLFDLPSHLQVLINVKSIYFGNFNGKFRKLQLSERSEAIADWVRVSAIPHDPIWGIVIDQLIEEYSGDFHFRLFLVDVAKVLRNLSDEKFLSKALSAFRDGDSSRELYIYLSSNIKNVQRLKELAEKLLESNDKYKDIYKALLGEIPNESYKFDSIQEFMGKEDSYDQNLKDLFEDWFKNFQRNFSADIKKLIIFANSDEWKTPYQKNEVKNLLLLIFSLLFLEREGIIGDYWGYFTISFIDEDILPNAMNFFSTISHDRDHDYEYLKGFGVVTNEDCKEIADSLKKLKKKLFPKATVPKNSELLFPYECFCADFQGKPSITMCGHLFCGPCITAWLTNQETCPSCRAKNPDPLPLKNVIVDEESKLHLSCSSNSCTTKPENLKTFYTLICGCKKRSVYCETCANNLKKCPECGQVPSKITKIIAG